MKQTSTKVWVPFKKCLVLLLTFVALSFSQSVFANQVTGYTASCMAGPVYSIDASVSNVNSTSNYAWQYKNAAGAWVCILNGNNTINGQTYSVSGATSTATTNPNPILFNNPNSGLQGLVIRCVISNGTGVNPCTMPAGNTWNSTSTSVNFTMNVTGTPCATQLLTLGNRVWYDTDNDGINDASENGIRNITVSLYKDDNNDNVADGAAIATAVTNTTGNYSFTNLNPGNYIVGAMVPNGYMSSSVNGGDPDNNTDLDDNGQVTAGNEIRGLAITLAAGTEPGGNTNNTYDFGMLPDCACTNSTSNLLVNGSFENGTTGWSWSNGTLTTGTGYVACGAKNGFNNWSSGTSKVWQDVAMAAGSTVTFSAFAGTHTPGISCSPKLSLIFLNASNTVLGQSDVTVTRDVDINNGQLQQYSITGVAPTGTTKVRVQSSITCNTMKIDAFCLTSLPPTLTLGNRVWYDTDNDGINDAGENGIRNVTVNLYKDANNDNVADGASVATQVTDVNGYYSFTNLLPGNYIVGAVVPNGYMSSSVNGGDPDNNTDLDDNGQVSAGNEMRGLGITLAVGTEPTSGNVNNTYDFGFLPDCACTNSTSNVLVNGSFENGTTGWSWSNGTLTTGTGYIACGAKNGFNNSSASGSKVWQDVAVGAGFSVTFSGYAGTHTAGISCSPKLSLVFLNAANTVLAQTDVAVTRDVDINNGQLEQYSITAISPTGTTKVRVQSTINCNTMKIDAFCLTLTPLSFNLSGNVWHDVNGMNDNLVNNSGAAQVPPAQSIPTGLRISRADATTGIVIAVALVQGNGTFFFPNVAPGDYILILSPAPGTIGQPAPFANLPSGWINTGEHLGITAGRDAVINGKLSVSLVNANVINCNFGIQLNNDDIGIN